MISPYKSLTCPEERAICTIVMFLSKSCIGISRILCRSNMTTSWNIHTISLQHRKLIQIIWKLLISTLSSSPWLTWESLKTTLTVCTNWKEKKLESTRSCISFKNLLIGRRKLGLKVNYLNQIQRLQNLKLSQKQRLNSINWQPIRWKGPARHRDSLGCQRGPGHLVLNYQKMTHQSMI